MNTVLIISLCIPAVISIIQFFLQEGKRTVQLVLAGLTILGLATTFFVTKDDAIENEQLKKSLNKIEGLLSQSETKILAQSKTINEGFMNLNNQLLNTGTGNAAILATVKDLKTQITQFNDESKNSVLKALEISNGALVTVNKSGVVVNDSYAKIPINEKNSVLLDTKNNLTIVDSKPDENWVLFRLNGRDIKFVPGNQTGFRTDQEKNRALVYQGKEDGRFVFYMHD